MNSIDATYARIILRYMIREDVSVAEALEGCGASHANLRNATEIDLETFRRLLENAERLLPTQPIGFVIGRHNNTLALGSLGIASGSAPTLRAGLQALASYTRVHANYFRVSLVSDLHVARCSFDITGLTGPALRHHTESTLMFLQWYVETLAGCRLIDAVNRVTYSAPKYAASYADYLHSPTLFDQAANGVDLPHVLLDERSPYFHPELWLQSQKQLAQSMRDMEDTTQSVFSDHVRSCLRAQPPPLQRLGEIAGQLHLSERTLNRRLQEEETSFRDLRNAEVSRWAQRLLLNSQDSIESIAATLGYEDTANFRRAFRNQHGITPSEFRSQHA